MLPELLSRRLHHLPLPLRPSVTAATGYFDLWFGYLFIAAECPFVGLRHLASALHLHQR
jgi:hypothetical protein